MFESAIAAAETAARTWSPECADQVGGGRCCTLCVHRYRALTLDGPLRLLPHSVAHPAVAAVDDLIAARLVEAQGRLGCAGWSVSVSDQNRTERDRAGQLARCTRAASGGLLLTALTELGAAAPRLEKLRRRYIEPAFAAYFSAHPIAVAPWT